MIFNLFHHSPTPSFSPSLRCFVHQKWTTSAEISSNFLPIKYTDLYAYICNCLPFNIMRGFSSQLHLFLVLSHMETYTICSLNDLFLLTRLFSSSVRHDQISPILNNSPISLKSPFSCIQIYNKLMFNKDLYS